MINNAANAIRSDIVGVKQNSDTNCSRIETRLDDIMSRQDRSDARINACLNELQVHILAKLNEPKPPVSYREFWEKSVPIFISTGALVVAIITLAKAKR